MLAVIWDFKTREKESVKVLLVKDCFGVKRIPAAWKYTVCFILNQ